MSTDPHVFMLILVPKCDIYQWWQWKCFFFFCILLPPPRYEYEVIWKLLRDLHISVLWEPLATFFCFSVHFSKLFSAEPHFGLMNFFSSQGTWLLVLVGVEAQLNLWWWFFFLLCGSRGKAEEVSAHSYRVDKGDTEKPLEQEASLKRSVFRIVRSWKSTLATHDTGGETEPQEGREPLPES